VDTMASAPLARRLSASDAASSAMELAKRRLFPFRFDRWLALGFVAFLDQCGRGGNPGANFGSRFRGDSNGDGDSGLPDVAQAQEWVSAHLGLIIAIAAAALVFIVGLMVVILWINSRGVFMYLDNVATGRSDVSRPWREHKDRAASYFVWSFGVGLGTFAGILVLLAPMVWAVLTLVSSGASGGAIAALIVIGLLMFVVVLGASLFSVLLRDFAAPLQLHLDVPCGHALRTAWELVRSSAGAFAVYVLLKIVFAIVAAMAAAIVGCVTCCLGFLPVVSQVLLQPLHYFERAWSLFMLRQAGYDLFPGTPPPPPPPPPPPLPSS
jgi:hypothetical protein